MDVFVGVEKIGISVVVPYDTADAVSSANIPRDPFLAAAEIERWPLAMAYGLEGVGRSGFFTMNFEVKDVCDTLRRTCYARLDRAALTRELDHNVPQFVAQWLDVADALEEASAGKRASLFSPGRTFDSREKKTNERAFAEALFDFFEYGSLRTPVGLRPACAVLDAPLVTLEKTHATVEATHPKSPGVKIARTFFLGDGARRAAAANGFVENDRFTPPGDECAIRDETHTDEIHAALLAGAHAGVVAAARAAARALFAFAGGEAESLHESFSENARAAFSEAAKASGVRGRRARAARGRARGGNKRDIVRARNRGDHERHTDIRTFVRVRPRRNRASRRRGVRRRRTRRARRRRTRRGPDKRRQTTTRVVTCFLWR